ncbi:MAG: DNA sulfur modification protein DndE [Burkholderiales bacterium]
MSALIERVRLTAAAKQQLSALKRRSGIEHYNVIARHALCASLANKTKVPNEALQFSGGLEIDWPTFAGDSDATLTNILILRAIAEEGTSSPAAVRKVLHAHLHRGLGYLTSDPSSLNPGRVLISEAEH